MIPVHVDLRGYDDLADKLGKDLSPALRAAALALAEEIRDKIARYPGPVSYPIKWQSERQRRFVMAMLADDLPYSRGSGAMSQTLGKSWTSAQYGAIGAVVGTKTTYAPYVQGEELQQDMHRATGWVTDRQAVDQVEESGVIERIYHDAIAHELR